MNLFRYKRLWSGGVLCACIFAQQGVNAESIEIKGAIR